MSVRELSPRTLSTGIPSTSHSMPTLAPTGGNGNGRRSRPPRPVVHGVGGSVGRGGHGGGG